MKESSRGFKEMQMDSKCVRKIAQNHYAWTPASIWIRSFWNEKL